MKQVARKPDALERVEILVTEALLLICEANRVALSEGAPVGVRAFLQNVLENMQPLMREIEATATKRGEVVPFPVQKAGGKG